MPDGITEAELRIDQIAEFVPDVQRVFIVENEVTFLSLPVPRGGILVWGRGYEVGTVALVEWMRDAEVAYWGDIDTHGFAILNRLRTHIPHANSVLMDRETMLHHQDRWGHEPKQIRADLHALTHDEREIYLDLLANRLGAQLRLEQEHVDWIWVLDRLPFPFDS